MKKITFVPAGGLGNRMKAMSAAMLLAQRCGSALDILWFQDWGLGCRFSQLFEPLEVENVSLRSPRLTDYVLFDRPRNKNFYLPLLFERLLFRKCMGERRATEAMERGFDFVNWAKGHRVWLSSHVYFMSKTVPDDAFDMFHPIAPLLQRVEEQARCCGDHAVGVHIRRTDNERSVMESPTEAFVQRMRQFPESVRFYLATDDESVKDELRKAFPQRIITSSEKAERGSVKGMQDALVEMYTLSKCSLILGSVASTFSMTAAAIGRVPLEIIKKQ